MEITLRRFAGYQASTIFELMQLIIFHAESYVINWQGAYRAIFHEIVGHVYGNAQSIIVAEIAAVREAIEELIVCIVLFDEIHEIKDPVSYTHLTLPTNREV